MQLSSDFFDHLKELQVLTGLDVTYQLDGEDVQSIDGHAPGRLYVLLNQVGLPAGVFKVASTPILFIGDYQYPESALDMFWTEENVVRADGGVPQNATEIEQYLGRRWRRYSWHRNGIWDPSRNGLLDHYEFMQQRIAEEVKR
jgi:hypothetical protein